VWRSRVSNVRGAPDIAVQREVAYHRPMPDTLTALPPDAVKVGTVGFNIYAGPIYRLSDENDGEIKHFAFLPEHKHMNGSGSVHGGMLMTFADVSMSQSARSVFDGHGCNTVSLSCDFVSPGKLGELVESRVRITRKTRTMAFISAELSSGGRPLLVATGLWKVASQQ
jgi:acyl-coenzyme A thioesterase PaaI-like protein